MSSSSNLLHRQHKKTPPRPLNPLKSASLTIPHGEDGDFPWIYLVFWGPGGARSEVEFDGRDSLDLVSPLLAGMRSLGGECFSLGKIMNCFLTTCIPRGGEEMPMGM